MPILSDAVWLNLAPRPRVRSVDWVAAHVKDPKGAPLDLDRVPWARGVYDAWDDPHIREIVLMWNARGFKSLLSASLLLCAAANTPDPMLFGSSTEKLTKRIIGQRLYPMIEHCQPLAGQLRPKGRRSQLCIELRDCRIQGAWSGSETMLADFSAVRAHANECDKWSTAASGEGDTLDQFLKRLAEYPDRKVLIEGTPQEKHTSRLYERLLAGDNRRFHVPCKHCHVFQELLRITRTKNNRDAGGVIWDTEADGRSEPDVAHKTARYLCPHCRKEWDDGDRAKMVRAGMWVPEGQHVDKQGRLKGTPRRPGCRIWSSQMSSFYSLDCTWGDLAGEYVAAERRPAKLKAFVQLTEGWVWEPRPSTTEPEQLGPRLRIELPMGTVPLWGRFLGLTCDVQKSTFPASVWAFGTDEQKHLVTYASLEKWSELAKLLGTLFPHADGGPPLPLAFALIDSGNWTIPVYRFCRKHNTAQRPVIACKGDDSVRDARYIDGNLGEGRSKSRRRAGQQFRGQRLVRVAIDAWEEEIEQQLEELKPGEAGSLSLCIEAAADIELCAQLLNGTQMEGIDKRGNPRLCWVKKDPDLPNDFRDDLRYALAGAALYLDERKGRLPERLTGAEQRRPPPPPAPRFTTPDGRPFLVTEREGY